MKHLELEDVLEKILRPHRNAIIELELEDGTTKIGYYLGVGLDSGFYDSTTTIMLARSLPVYRDNRPIALKKEDIEEYDWDIVAKVNIFYRSSKYKNPSDN